MILGHQHTLPVRLHRVEVQVRRDVTAVRLEDVDFTLDATGGAGDALSLEEYQTVRACLELDTVRKDASGGATRSRLVNGSVDDLDRVLCEEEHGHILCVVVLLRNHEPR